MASINDELRLERRVEPSARLLVADATGSEGRASEHLALAWAAAHGRTPSPSEAYRESVRAVEAAFKPVILPKDATATLGKMLPALRDGRGKWRVLISTADGSSQDAVIGMLSLLWRGQHDRHGTDDESVPLSVSIEEARAAVQLAATLVQWCRDGTVAPVP